MISQNWILYRTQRETLETGVSNMISCVVLRCQKQRFSRYLKRSIGKKVISVVPEKVGNLWVEKWNFQKALVWASIDVRSILAGRKKYFCVSLPKLRHPFSTFHNFHFPYVYILFALIGLLPLEILRSGAHILHADRSRRPGLKFELRILKLDDFDRVFIKILFDFSIFCFFVCCGPHIWT